MKETWKMIALLAIAIGVLLAYAFIPEQVAENIPLKQIGMDALTGKSEAELAEEEKADSMIKEPVDTAAQRVLIFGDSMSEYLGLRLADYANKNGHKLTCITWVSSGTNGEREMAYALYLAGFEVKDVMMTDLISGRETLDEVNIQRTAI